MIHNVAASSVARAVQPRRRPLKSKGRLGSMTALCPGKRAKRTSSNAQLSRAGREQQRRSRKTKSHGDKKDTEGQGREYGDQKITILMCKEQQ